MENNIVETAQGAKAGIFKVIGAALGAAAAFFTGLPPLAKALLIIQGADIATGVLCALTGRSPKTESGTMASGALFVGLIKKALEWLVVLVCDACGTALDLAGITGAAMAYMMATELVSLTENLTVFGLRVPLLEKLLDVAHKRAGDEGKDEKDEDDKDGAAD